MRPLYQRLRHTADPGLETYPWPAPTGVQRARIAELAARLVVNRQAITVREGIGLTDLYNAIDDGAWRPIADLHRGLDEAVLDAYGWPPQLRDDPLELKLRLAARHAEVLAGERPYAPFDD